MLKRIQLFEEGNVSVKEAKEIEGQKEGLSETRTENCRTSLRLEVSCERIVEYCQMLISGPPFASPLVLPSSDLSCLLAVQ